MYWKNKKYDLKVLAFTKLDEFIKTDRYSYTIPGRLHKKWGYQDSSGSFTIAARFDEIKSINTGLISVKIKDLYGIIDKDGNAILPLIYEEIQYYNDGFFKIKYKRLYGLVDKDGNEIIPPNYEEIEKIHSMYKVKKNNLYGVIDTAKNLVLPIEYDAIFNSPFAMILKKGNKFGLADNIGNIKIPLIYDQITSGYGDIFTTQIKNLFGIIKFNDNIIIEPQYSTIEFIDYSKDLEKYVFKFKSDDSWGVLDENNQIIIKPEWEDINSNFYCDRDVLTVQKNKLYGAIDIMGNIIVKPEYNYTMGPDVNVGEIRFYKNSGEYNSVPLINK